MSTSPFEVSVDETEEGSVVRLAGDLTYSSQPGLDAAYETASRSDGVIVLDFEHAGFIDSSGIAVILRLLRRAREDGRTVAARNLSSHYREVFQITRISDFMILPGAEGSGGVDQLRSNLDERNGGF